MALVKLIIAILLGMAALPVCGWLFSEEVGQAWRMGLPPDALAVYLGVGIGLALIWWRRPSSFVQTFLHETAHALACVLLWVRVRGFHVTDTDGGYVLPDHTDPIRRTLILIAPYTLPVLLAPVLLLRLMVDSPGAWRWSLQLLAGLFLVLHLYGLIGNIRRNFWGPRADLPRVGRPLAMVLIAGIGLLVLAWWLDAVWH